MSAVAHIDEYKKGTFFSDAFRGDMSWNGYEHNVLLRNLGNGPDGTPHFIDVAPVLGADTMNDARGIAVFDFDNDGDPDIAVNHNPGDQGREQEGIPAVLLRNDIGQGNHWLGLDLVGVESNRDAIGAEAVVVAGDLRQWRHVTAGSGYAGQRSRRLLFGLGDHATVDRIELRWPSGKTQTLGPFSADRYLTIEEGRTPADAVPADGLPGGGP